jgi:hypothetical protein
MIDGLKSLNLRFRHEEDEKKNSYLYVELQTKRISVMQSAISSGEAAKSLMFKPEQLFTKVRRTDISVPPVRGTTIGGVNDHHEKGQPATVNGRPEAQIRVVVAKSRPTCGRSDRTAADNIPAQAILVAAAPAAPTNQRTATLLRVDSSVPKQLDGTTIVRRSTPPTKASTRSTPCSPEPNTQPDLHILISVRRQPRVWSDSSTGRGRGRENTLNTFSSGVV